MPPRSLSRIDNVELESVAKQREGAASTVLKFDAKKTVAYWLDGAKYDLSVANALYEKKKYPYALFMGHLALEKLLKALIVEKTKKHAPYTHSLTLLADAVNIELPPKLMKRLPKFMEFHFEARYPKQQMKFYKKCTKAFTHKKLHEITEVYTWLIGILKKK